MQRAEFCADDPCVWLEAAAGAVRCTGCDDCEEEEDAGGDEDGVEVDDDGEDW
jgi:hypothetical protein